MNQQLNEDEDNFGHFEFVFTAFSAVANVVGLGLNWHA